jgi:PncC family amidohydrolase
MISDMIPVSLVKKLGSLLSASGKTLVSAESCTGGLFSKTITELPGSSVFFLGGVVAYHNALKQRLLNVKPDTLEKYGAVSAQAAEEMALGILTGTGGSLAVSITGIAGPGGGTPDKPVGTVYIGLTSGGEVKVYKLALRGSRSMIREHAVRKALELLLRLLQHGKNW